MSSLRPRKGDTLTVCRDCGASLMVDSTGAFIASELAMSTGPRHQRRPIRMCPACKAKFDAAWVLYRERKQAVTQASKQLSKQLSKGLLL